jgi:hypothetical protein
MERKKRSARRVKFTEIHPIEVAKKNLEPEFSKSPAVRDWPMNSRVERDCNQYISADPNHSAELTNRAEWVNDML